MKSEINDPGFVGWTYPLYTQPYSKKGSSQILLTYYMDILTNDDHCNEEEL